MKNRILNSPAKMSMHFLVAKRVMLQIRAFLRTFLVDIMLCGRYLVDNVNIWLILSRSISITTPLAAVNSFNTKV